MYSSYYHHGVPYKNVLLCSVRIAWHWVFVYILPHSR